jgi:predicted transcriptional regulator
MKLSEIERELLQLIFEKSVLKKMTEIQDINTLLGCNNKNIDIQKRLRSDAINALNDKMSLLLLTDKKVIERKRSAFDGRSFEYYIDQQYFTAIQQLLNHSASA